MLKYTTEQVVFSEVPDEISLAINISNCPIHCNGCHSKELWGDIGAPLTEQAIMEMLQNYSGVTCVCFMGGDAEPVEVNKLSKWIHNFYNGIIKTAWYSGRDEWPTFIPDFDYVKIGSYDENKGPINVKTTNQKMARIVKTENNWYMDDITYKFWRNDTNS